MYEHDDAERFDRPEREREHPAFCGCHECDPDFYFDPADASPEED